MPIAKDDGTRAAGMSNVDQVIMDIIGEQRAVKAASASTLPKRPAAAEVAALAKGDLPNFNPEALIAAGRVSQAPPIMGPYAQKPTYDVEMKQIPPQRGLLQAPAPRREKPAPEQKITQAPEPKRPMQGKRPKPAEPGPQYKGVTPERRPEKTPAANGMAGPMRVLPEVVDELAMKTGATTTFEEVENGTTGVPAWDARIEESLTPPPAEMPPQYSTGIGARGGIPSVDLRAQAEQKVKDARQAERQHDKSVDRAVGNGPSGTKVLGAKGYKELSPDQKAAVDFNTLLQNATRRDKKLRTDPDVKLSATATPGESTTYGEDVNKVYGEQVGPAVFAPNTLNLLNSIGFETKDLDMNDFLKLKVGITQSDLENFTLEPIDDALLMTAPRQRLEMQQKLVEAFRNTRQDQVAGAGLKNLQRGLLGQEEQIGFQNLAADTPAPVVEQQTKFQRGLSALAQPQYAADKDKILAGLKAEFSEPEWQSFINYLDVSSREAMQYRRPLGEDFSSADGQTLDYMLPRDFRKHMGF